MLKTVQVARETKICRTMAVFTTDAFTSLSSHSCWCVRLSWQHEKRKKRQHFKNVPCCLWTCCEVVEQPGSHWWGRQNQVWRGTRVCVCVYVVDWRKMQVSPRTHKCLKACEHGTWWTITRMRTHKLKHARTHMDTHPHRNHRTLSEVCHSRWSLLNFVVVPAWNIGTVWNVFTFL